VVTIAILGIWNLIRGRSREEISDAEIEANATRQSHLSPGAKVEAKLSFAIEIMTEKSRGYFGCFRSPFICWMEEVPANTCGKVRSDSSLIRECVNVAVEIQLVQSVANGDSALDVVGSGDQPGLFQAEELREMFPNPHTE
jgi:hypothetical protein